MIVEDNSSEIYKFELHFVALSFFLVLATKRVGKMSDNGSESKGSSDARKSKLSKYVGAAKYDTKFSPTWLWNTYILSPIQQARIAFNALFANAA